MIASRSNIERDISLVQDTESYYKVQYFFLLEHSPLLKIWQKGTDCAVNVDGSIGEPWPIIFIFPLSRNQLRLRFRLSGPELSFEGSIQQPLSAMPGIFGETELFDALIALRRFLVFRRATHSQGHPPVDSFPVALKVVDFMQKNELGLASGDFLKKVTP